MNIIGAIINFFISLIYPTWGCSEADLDEMKIVKGYLPTDVIMDDDSKA